MAIGLYTAESGAADDEERRGSFYSILQLIHFNGLYTVVDFFDSAISSGLVQSVFRRRAICA